MLYLYDKNTIDFTNNGEPISHSYDEHVIREDGFYLTFKLLLDINSDYKKVKKEMIVSAETPDGRNQFRVYDIVKRKDHVEVVAVQLMYDLDNKMVNPFKVNNVSGTTVINRFISSFKSSLGAFTLSSSVAETHDFSTNDENDDTPSQNALEVLNRITNRWDSELLVNGYDIRMIKRLGTRTNALLYEKKNISNFEDESTVRNMATRIHATSRFIAEGDDEETVISVSVDSPLINEYAQVYEKSFVNNDARTTQELVKWVNLKYSTENIDKPKRNINVSTNIIDGTEINYGDELVLKYLVHDVDEVIRCVGYDYNPVAQTYYSITLGGWKDSFATTLTGGIVDVTQRQVNQIKKNITHILMNADGYHRNAYGPESVPNPINGDVWYYFEWDRPNEIEMRIFEDGFWVPVPFGTKAEIEAALSEAETAKQVAEQSYLDSVAEAERLIGEQNTAFEAEMAIRQGEIQDAKTQADLAVGKATANAEAIFGKLDLATYEANKTVVETELGKKLATATYNAQKQTQDASIAGKVALTTYNAKMTSLDTAINGTSLRVDELEDGFALTATKTEVDSLKTRLNTAELNITATSNQLALKASQTDLNAATGRLTTAEGRITANANAIELRATKTDVDSLTGRVTTAEGTITTQAGQIALRATTATVNALTSRVSAAEASLVVQSGKIDLAATKTELTTAIDGIKIGGRNLAKGTSSDFAYVRVGPYSGNLAGAATSQFRYTLEELGVQVGDTMTVSMYVGESEGGYGGAFRIDDQNGQNKYSTYKVAKNGYVSETFTILEGTTEIRLYTAGVGPSGAGASFDLPVKELKLEKGNKATDWTPAPEDVDAAISTVQSNLTVEAGKITALTTRVSGAESNITSVTQTVSGINTTISTLRTDVNGKATIVALNQVKSTADGNKTTITNHSGRLTTVESNVSGLQTTVSNKADKSQITQLENSISSIVSKGTNSITNGDFTDGLNGWRVNSGSAQVRTLINGEVALSLGPSATGVYLHAEDYGHADDFYTFTIRAKKDLGGTALLHIGFLNLNSYYNTTFTLTENWETYSFTTRYPVVATGGQRNFHVYSRAGNVGNIYIDWITLQRGSYASESQITQLSDLINLRVTKGGLMSEINVQAGRTIISTGKLYLDTGSTIMTTAYVNDLKAKSLEAITANITSIRSQVLVADSVASTHVKADNAMIDNIFGTTALITRLTSKTAFISNIQAINISADKITAGTLNASNVNIINMNASNIVTGTLSAIKVVNTFNRGSGVTGTITIDSDINMQATDGSRFLLSEKRISFSDGDYETVLKKDGIEFFRGGVKHMGQRFFTYEDGTSGIRFESRHVGERALSIRGNQLLSHDGAGGREGEHHLYLSPGGTGYVVAGDATGARAVMRARTFELNRGVGLTTYDTGEAKMRLYSEGFIWHWGMSATASNQMLRMDSDAFRMYKDLDMTGRVVKNTSDRRFKSGIRATSVNGRDIIRKLNFVDFFYTKENYPTDLQFGLIGQDAPFIGMQGEDGYWSINTTRQTMLNSLVAQEHDRELTRVSTFINQHDEEIKLLKNKIKQLEEKIA